MARKINTLIRSSSELRQIVNYIKAKHIMEGKKPPTTADITKMIAKKIDKEELLRDVFIKF